VYRGCGRVDPPSGHKEQRGKRPKKHCGDDKPSDEGPQTTFAARGLAACGWSCSHRFRIIAWAGYRLRRTCARCEPTHRKSAMNGVSAGVAEAGGDAVGGGGDDAVEFDGDGVVGEGCS
jgi:hypothetical protein